MKVEAAFALTVVALTVVLNVVVPALIVIVDKGLELPPITLANVFPVPETLIVPSIVAKPLIVPVIVAAVPENVAVALYVVLSSKVIAVTVTVFAKFANEFSSVPLPPAILILVPDTVPSNFAEPALSVDPIVIVSDATSPENVITEGAPLALLITSIVDVPLSTISPATVMSPPVRLNKIVDALLIVVAVTAFAKVVIAFVLIVVAATVLLKVVVPAPTVMSNKE